MSLDVHGLENVPRDEPVLVVSRHVHHTYDGVIFLALIPRDIHIVVALDWVPFRALRRVMEVVCRLAGWPAVLRQKRLSPQVGSRGQAAFSEADSARFLRRAVKACVGILRAGEVLVMFPEAYPVIDPLPGPERGEDALLPFRRGFVELVRLAERDGSTRVAVVPVGLRFERGQSWKVTARFGTRLYLDDFAGPALFSDHVAAQVRLLSDLDT